MALLTRARMEGWWLIHRRRAGAPLDCEMSEWAEWGECSAKCRGGEHNRTRHIISQPRYGGKDCGPEFEVQPCNTGLCGAPHASAAYPSSSP